MANNEASGETQETRGPGASRRHVYAFSVCFVCSRPLYVLTALSLWPGGKEAV